MNDISLLVLAAGLGSRYGGCKQIDPVGPNQEIILEYSLYDAWLCGFKRAVLVVRQDMEEWLNAHLRPRLGDRLALDFVNQELTDLPVALAPRILSSRQKPWGTGHAVWVARQRIKQPFAVVNADDFYGRESFQLLADFLGADKNPGDLPDYALAGYRLASTLSLHGTVARGICQVDQASGWLRNIEEQTDIVADPHGLPMVPNRNGGYRRLDPDICVSLNAWGFTPDLFARLDEQFRTFLTVHGEDAKREFFLPTAVAELIHRRHCRVKVLPTPASWFGMTYKQDHAMVRARIRELIDQGVYRHSLWTDN